MKQTTAANTIRMIDQYEIDTTIYTDGSCSGGTAQGGSAAVITTGTAANPVVLETIRKKGGIFTCSYQEEKDAVQEALKWMKTNQKYGDTVICTDSQALLTSIENMSADTAEIRRDLQTLHGKTYMHWIPGHSNIPGNELADKAAKEAAMLPESDSEPTPISYGVARAVVKGHVKDRDPVHPVVSEAYKGYIRKSADHKVNNRRDAALLAQLRSGHCLELAHYRNRIDPTKSATCPRCGEVDETVKHWISCPATIMIREQIFGRANLSLDILTKNPESALAFAEENLRKQRTTSDACP